MGSWRRMGAFLGLVAQDDRPRDDLEYEAEYDSEYDAGYERDSAAVDYDEPYAGRSVYSDGDARIGRRGGRPAPMSEPMTQGALAVQMHPQDRRHSETGSSSRPLTVKLTGFAEARIIGERYRDGASVILDMTDLTDSDARRVVDFAAGLAFALHGSIDKVTARVFMLLPPHVDLSADDRRAVAATSLRRV